MMLASCAKETVDPMHYTKIFNALDPTNAQLVSVCQLKTGQYIVLMKDVTGLPYLQVMNEDGSFNQLCTQINSVFKSKNYTVDIGFHFSSDGKTYLILNEEKRNGFDIYEVDNAFPVKVDFIGQVYDQNDNFNVAVLDFEKTGTNEFVCLYQYDYNSIVFSKRDGNMKEIKSYRHSFDTNEPLIYPYYPIEGVRRLEHYILDVDIPSGITYSYKSFFGNQSKKVYLNSDLGIVDTISVASNDCEPVKLDGKEIYCTIFENNCQYTIHDENENVSKFTQYDQDGTKPQTIKMITIKNKHLMVATGTSKHGRAMLIFFDADQHRFITTQNFGSGNSLYAQDLVVTNDNGLALFGNTDVAGFISKPFMIKLTESDLVSTLKKAGYSF